MCRDIKTRENLLPIPDDQFSPGHHLGKQSVRLRSTVEAHAALGHKLSKNKPRRTLPPGCLLQQKQLPQQRLQQIYQPSQNPRGNEASRSWPEQKFRLRTLYFNLYLCLLDKRVNNLCSFLIIQRRPDVHVVHDFPEGERHPTSYDHLIYLKDKEE